MPFPSSHEADVRLVGDNSPLTQQEVRDLMPWMNQLSTGAVRRLEAELALQNIEAVQNFERSSSKLTNVLIWLTAALVLLTGVIAYLTVFLIRLPKA